MNYEVSLQVTWREALEPFVKTYTAPLAVAHEMAERYISQQIALGGRTASQVSITYRLLGEHIPTVIPV
jgi:hypothetical protein